jgi:hypothetical protein
MLLDLFLWEKSVHYAYLDLDCHLLKVVEMELQMLIDGDTSSMVWHQVASTLDGPQGYGLERVGLLPPLEE